MSVLLRGCTAVNVEVRTDSVMIVSSKFAGLELSAQEFGRRIQLCVVDRHVLITREKKIHQVAPGEPHVDWVIFCFETGSHRECQVGLKLKCPLPLSLGNGRF